MDKFEELLKELSHLIGSPLTPDSKSTCLLVFNNGVKIQLELDKSADFLIIGASLGELPPGKYREQILIAALKSNHLGENGILAFSLKKKELVLFEKLPFESVNAKELFEKLQKLVDKTHFWQETLSSQSIPAPQASSSSQSIFNLKP